MVLVPDVKSVTAVFLSSKCNSKGKTIVKCRNCSPDTTIQNTSLEPGMAPSLDYRSVYTVTVHCTTLLILFMFSEA